MTNFLFKKFTLTQIRLAPLIFNQSFQMIWQMKDMTICERIRYYMSRSEHFYLSYKQEEIKRIWTQDIPLELCATLARSMPARLQAIIEADGGHTKY